MSDSIPEEPNREEEERLVKQHVAALSEHFDSVQIFVSRHDPAIQDGTVTVSWGAGNWYARAGQIREWILRQEEITRRQIQKEEQGDAD